MAFYFSKAEEVKRSFSEVHCTVKALSVTLLYQTKRRGGTCHAFFLQINCGDFYLRESYHY